MRSFREEIVHYFPDDPDNKVYAVDVYVTVCKPMFFEAKDINEAEQKADAWLSALLRDCVSGPDGDKAFVHALANEGFVDGEETEIRVSGEADKDGIIQYS